MSTSAALLMAVCSWFWALYYELFERNDNDPDGYA